MNHKHLGLTLDTKLTFASHIDEKLKKAHKGLGIIKYNQWGFPCTPNPTITNNI